MLNNESILTWRNGDLLNRGALRHSGEGSYCFDNLNEETSRVTRNQHMTVYFRSLPIC